MKVPRKSAAASWQRVDGEMVLMQVEAGELLGLNAVGGRTWELIDGQRSLEEIAAAIASEFGIEVDRARSDVEAFLGQLGAAKLIE